MCRINKALQGLSPPDPNLSGRAGILDVFLLAEMYFLEEPLRGLDVFLLLYMEEIDLLVVSAAL